jgi:OmpA-OmpF porin, OOP family
MLKKILTTTVLGVSALGAMAANAATPGLYVTGQLGYVNNNMKLRTHDLLPNNDISASSLGGRVAVGYQFNQNFALETGYFRAAQKKVTLVSGSVKSPVIGNVTLDQNAIDLLAKGTLSINSALNLYGKLGVAYLTTDFNTDSGDKRFDPIIQNFAKRKFAPEAAVGVSYDITPNVSLDTSWTHIHTLGKNQPGNINFIALGLGYNFG